jgi:hypothetical protein
MRKIISLSIVGILLFLAVFFFVRYYFVFGEGVKAGDLNFIVHKGFVFKTWEGRVIQTGIKTYTPGAIQSNEFEFSVSNDSVAKVLELNSGKFVELRYKEYLHALPWRGNSKYVVYEIVNIAEREKP